MAKAKKSKTVNPFRAMSRKISDLFSVAPKAPIKPAPAAARPAQAAVRPAQARAKAAASVGSGAEGGYTARHIEVLEGLEPVRRRPGMYIGGTDEKALHHLFAEAIDNSMHQPLPRHATFIPVSLRPHAY